MQSTKKAFIHFLLQWDGQFAQRTFDKLLTSLAVLTFFVWAACRGVVGRGRGGTRPPTFFTEIRAKVSPTFSTTELIFYVSDKSLSKSCFRRPPLLFLGLHPWLHGHQKPKYLHVGSKSSLSPLSFNRTRNTPIKLDSDCSSNQNFKKPLLYLISPVPVHGTGNCDMGQISWYDEIVIENLEKKWIKLWCILCGYNNGFGV